jgi:TolA-binding protein
MVPHGLAVALLVIGISPAAAAEPWHRPVWQARAIVEIPSPSTAPGVDTAAVRILCQGRARADGNDYVVLDAAGKPVPFQIMFHDAGRYSLLAFQADNPRQRFYVYFGNPKAKRPAEQIDGTVIPGLGPPRAPWIPRYGLVLETIQRPEGANPQTIEEMARLIAGGKARYGARYQRRIADGYNQFGPSDYYISIYRGWLRIPHNGKYQFCTVSNEASFSFLDGKPLVHWPGRHTVERGIHGEKNVLVELTAGLHYIEYYHEEVTLEQMAFLGWRPSADKGAFSAIPESVYTAPHDAQVTRYEDVHGPLLHFEPVITDSIWPAERHEGQYTRCQFRVGQSPAPAPGTTFRWDFGDGQSATGAEVEHVYLALGTYPVTLTAQGPREPQTARWPLEIYAIDHVTDQFKEGLPKDYARLARTYDRTRLDAASLKELAYLLAESDEPARAIEAGKEWLARFGPAQPDLAGHVRRLLADCMVRLGQGNLDEAVAFYRASLTPATPLPEKLDVHARLIRLLGIEANQPEKAREVVAQVEEAVRGAKMNEEVRTAYRRAIAAAGDVQLWHGRVNAAREDYQRAEGLRDRPIPPQVRAARIGAYPNAIREFLAAGNLGAALDVVGRWEDTFPTDKPNGQTFFWRGKVLLRRGQARDAARYLARGVALAPGAAWESEGRWLLAEALEQLKRPEDARRELAKLVASGIQDKFAQKARAKLQGK